MTPFVGRKEELRDLRDLLLKKSASLIAVRGRRRIGKSRLIEEFSKDKKFIRFSGVPPLEGTTAQEQRDIFAKQLGNQFGIPGLKAEDWSDLFTLLVNQTREGSVVILFDEISWMGSKDHHFLGKLKNAWDIEFKQNPNLLLVLCGSVSTWIEQNIIRNTAFFGRISLNLILEDLPLNDCNRLLELNGFRGSVLEKFKVLSVTGGIPWYIENIKSKKNADDNIKDLCFRKSGILFDEYDLIFHDLFTRRSDVYKKIIEALAKGPLEFNEIQSNIDYAKSGVLSEYLDDLIKAGFISRDFTWGLKTGNLSRLSQFRLSDNYLRFYLKYVEKNRQKILQGDFNDVSLSSLPEWNSIMGLQFENLVLKNRKKVKKVLGLKPEDIISDNPYFQRKTKSQDGCQIDYLIQTRHNVLFACEIKFSKNEIKSDIIHEMKDKMMRLNLPRGFSCSPVLIHVNGVSESVIEKDYFYQIIDFGDMLTMDD